MSKSSLKTIVFDIHSIVEFSVRMVSLVGDLFQIGKCWTDPTFIFSAFFIEWADCQEPHDGNGEDHDAWDAPK